MDDLEELRRQNANLFAQLEAVKKHANDKQLEVAHCHAVCGELRQKLDQAQAQAFGAGCQNQIVAAVTAQRFEELERQLQSIIDAFELGNGDDLFMAVGRVIDQRIESSAGGE